MPKPDLPPCSSPAKTGAKNIPAKASDSALAFCRLAD